MKQKYFILAIITVMVLSAVALKYFEKAPRYGAVVIDDKEFRVEIADTIMKRARGLGGRNGFKDVSGMLFVFPNFGKHGIWMKNMKFPIDIVWLSNEKVIDISPNASPELGTSLIFYPREEANYVLELPANFAEDNNLTVEGSIKIKN